ncbi:MAG TPA: glycosyltransferase [Terriglobales bacterium]|nr:glycosyltransferase [Terriglobales bacterium]
MSSLRKNNCQDHLRVLYVAYPLFPVSEHSAGGAELILLALEREMHARDHRTTVAACAGSRVAGELFSTGEPADGADQFEKRSEEQTRMLLDWLCSGAAERFDLVHDMSGGFWEHAERLPLPVMATLHLPPQLYKHANFSSVPGCVSFNCVSQSQMGEFRDLPRLIGIAPNGIDVERFSPEPMPLENRDYFLWLGRICEEKGAHTALDVAHTAGKQVVISGTVYPFLYHQKYFAREIIPRLKRAGRKAKYIAQPSFNEKVDLIRNARALLITSEVNETSSVVAMEAAACGTPVVALRRGALPEIIEEGVTGFLVHNVEEMASALSRVGEIDPEKCREHAQQYYSSQHMADVYEELYRKVLEGMLSIPA